MLLAIIPFQGTLLCLNHGLVFEFFPRPYVDYTDVVFVFFKKSLLKTSVFLKTNGIGSVHSFSVS
jgi:hypothetical protein